MATSPDELQLRVQQLAMRSTVVDMPTPTKPKQLPIWQNHLRGLPNALARSALFSVSKTKLRHQFKEHEVATVKGVRIVYSGEELRQDDEDIFLQITHLCRLQSLEDGIRFSPYSLLKALGIAPTVASYRRLRACLERLHGARLKLTALTHDGSDARREVYSGYLIRKFTISERAEAAAGEDKKGRWRLWLEPEIVAMFGPNDYSLLDFDQRLQLTPMGKWLHQFYHTHREPFGYEVTYIHRLCQSNAKELRHFRKTLKDALAELVRIGFLESWKLNNDVVLVSRVSRR